MTTTRLLMFVCLLVTFPPLAVRAQQPNASRDDRTTPEGLGLPSGNSRTSEPFITRIYKTDDGGEILKPQLKGYPFTIHEDYTLKENVSFRQSCLNRSD